MERSDVINAMGKLRLYGMKAAYDEVLRITEDRPIHSDNMRPPVPGYSPTLDALP